MYLYPVREGENNLYTHLYGLLILALSYQAWTAGPRYITIKAVYKGVGRILRGVQFAEIC